MDDDRISFADTFPGRDDEEHDPVMRKLHELDVELDARGREIAALKKKSDPPPPQAPPPAASAALAA